MSDDRQREQQEQAADAARVELDTGARQAGASDPARDDETWLEQVRDAYAPPPMTPAERRAFDARLEERIEHQTRRGLFGLRPWQPIAAAAVVVAAAWLVLSPFRPAPEPVARLSPTPATFASTRQATSLADWEREILAAAEPGATTTTDVGDDILPDDYRAIAGLFLAGGGGAMAHAR